MPQPKLFIAFIFSLAIFAALEPIAPSARAQAPTPIFVPVALAPIQRDSPIELVALTFDADIHEMSGHTIITGTSTFKVYNTERLNDLQTPVGFAAWAGDPFAFDPSRLDVFAVAVEGKKTTLTLSKADLKIGNTVRNVDWYTFTLAIAGDEKKTVNLDFQQDLGDGAMPRITYGLVPANGWKGNIGSARLTLEFPETTTLEQIVAYDPPNPTFDGNSITWLFQNYDAPANPYVTIIKPSVWNDLLVRRRAARQNPNDANARAALGAVYRQLAQIDSPKSESFYSQAVAELESAARLDTNLKSARQSLAVLYEARAGPATGPRKATYVQLAAQNWEALAPGDANARKQLAEDYFYLALDAQTRGAYADAQSYFDKASALAPSGAGPLFTPDRAAAQKRTLNIAWARTALDKDDTATAMDRARAAFGDAFMKSFQAPAFYIAQSQVTMSSNARVMTFGLTPFASSPAELQNKLSGVVASARVLGADANVGADNSNFILTLSAPFDTPAQLNARLAALAKIFGGASDWTLVRAVLTPTELAWSENNQGVAEMMRYREGVDLSEACTDFNAQLQATSSPGNIAGNDEEAQLKRALVKTAQEGWQSALAQSRVIYRAGSDEFSVEPCATRVIASSPIAIQPLGIALIAIAIQVVVGGIALVWRRKRRRVTKRGTPSP